MGDCSFIENRSSTKRGSLSPSTTQTMSKSKSPPLSAAVFEFSVNVPFSESCPSNKSTSWHGWRRIPVSCCTARAIAPTISPIGIRRKGSKSSNIRMGYRTTRPRSHESDVIAESSGSQSEAAMTWPSCKARIPSSARANAGIRNPPPVHSLNVHRARRMFQEGITGLEFPRFRHLADPEDNRPAIRAHLELSRLGSKQVQHSRWTLVLRLHARFRKNDVGPKNLRHIVFHHLACTFRLST